jgi:hypothetical protein
MDRRESFVFGPPFKLLEILTIPPNGQAIAMLLAVRGGNHKAFGLWAGDRVLLLGSLCRLVTIRPPMHVIIHARRPDVRCRNCGRVRQCQPAAATSMMPYAQCNGKGSTIDERHKVCESTGDYAEFKDLSVDAWRDFGVHDPETDFPVNTEDITRLFSDDK